ncbi:hypothetical protein ACFX11_014448 [Malus domestica]
MSDKPKIQNVPEKEKDVEFHLKTSRRPGEATVDLNEFLQQLGVLEKERQSDATAKTETFIAPESSIGEVQDEFGPLADKNINWDALIEMHRISNQGADACSFPTSTGNFKKN